LIENYLREKSAIIDAEFLEKLKDTVPIVEIGKSVEFKKIEKCIEFRSFNWGFDFIAGCEEGAVAGKETRPDEKNGGRELGRMLPK
jgi:hypothetical protein